MIPDVRDVYTAIIYYKGLKGDKKLRPVVIINMIDSKRCTIAEITSVPPKDPPNYFARFKEPILKWQECGLDKASWVKCFKENIHNINVNRLHQYIGTMNYQDFINVVKNIYDNT
ncbi:MAG: hypothetical protein WCR27_08000 [Eubacteriales bacterium]